MIDVDVLFDMTQC